MKRKPVHACYWLIGARNRKQAPGVAVDLHDDDADLVCETTTFDLKPGEGAYRARALAVDFARRHGIPANHVSHDTDSTAFYADC